MRPGHSGRIGLADPTMLASLRSDHERQPLVGVALFFLAGIACGFRSPDGLALLFLLPLFAVWLFLAHRGRIAAGGKVGLLLGTFVIGAILSLHTVSERDRQCEQLLSYPVKREFSCRIPPSIKVTNRKGDAAQYTFFAQDFTDHSSGEKLTQLPIRVNWFGLRPDASPADGQVPRAGESWIFSGTFRPVLNRSGLLYAEMNTSESSSRRLAVRDLSSWRGRADAARDNAVRRTGIGLEGWPVVPDLIRAILLGCRQEIPAVIRHTFADSGTVHIFAISGMHIMLVAAILTFAISLLRIPRMYWAFAVVPLLIFYTVLTGARPSAVRACIMSIFVLSAPLFGRRSNGLSALCATAILVLASDPALLFDLGCQLSFTVMIGLVLFCRPFCYLAERAFGVHAVTRSIRQLRLAGKTEKELRGRRLLRFCLRFEANVFAVSVAAWLVSLPLTALYFGRFTPCSLLANLVIAPCSLFVVVSGVMGLLTSFVSTFVAACFNNAAGGITAVMIATAKFSAELPGGCYTIPAWSTGAVIAWFAGLLLLAAVLEKWGRNRFLADLE